jgi:putative Holliday junction resolvase
MTGHDAALGPVLALDFGDANTGVAISDELCTVARPLEPIPNAASSDGMASIGDLVLTNAATRVVVGLPIGLSGSDTPQTARTRSFAGRLRALVDVPVDLFDERFTTRQADETARLTGSEASRDSLAACHLLTAWMEAHSA